MKRTATLTITCEHDERHEGLVTCIAVLDPPQAAGESSLVVQTLNDLREGMTIQGKHGVTPRVAQGDM